MVGVDLTTIDGVGVETAEVIVSEYGTDLSKFATEKQFVAHLKLAPRQAISGGKSIRKPGQKPKKTKGTRAGQALRNAATGVRRSLSALGAYYRRLPQQRSPGGSIRNRPQTRHAHLSHAALGPSICGHWSRAIRGSVSTPAAPLIDQHCHPVRLRPRAKSSGSKCLKEQEVSDENDGGTENARRAHEKGAQAGADTIRGTQVGRTLATAIEDQQLMPDQRGFGDNGTESARPCQSGHGDDHMNE